VAGVSVVRLFAADDQVHASMKIGD
jgi:hypothetical protein